MNILVRSPFPIQHGKYGAQEKQALWDRGLEAS